MIAMLERKMALNMKISSGVLSLPGSVAFGGLFLLRFRDKMSQMNLTDERGRFFRLMLAEWRKNSAEARSQIGKFLKSMPAVCMFFSQSENCKRFKESVEVKKSAISDPHLC